MRGEKKKKKKTRATHISQRVLLSDRRTAQTAFELVKQISERVFDARVSAVVPQETCLALERVTSCAR